VSSIHFYNFPLVNVAERRRFRRELEPSRDSILVDLARSEVVALNDEVGRRNHDLLENILRVNGEYAILRLLAKYFL